MSGEFRRRLEVLDRVRRWWPQLSAAQSGDAAELIWQWATQAPPSLTTEVAISPVEPTSPSVPPAAAAVGGAPKMRSWSAEQRRAQSARMAALMRQVASARHQAAREAAAQESAVALNPIPERAPVVDPASKPAREGIAKAKAEGKYVGRKPTARAKAADVFALRAAGVGTAEIARRVGIGRASVYRILGAGAAAAEAQSAEAVDGAGSASETKARQTSGGGRDGGERPATDTGIDAAAQGPAGAPRRTAGADGQAVDVDAPPGTRAPEKVSAGGEAAKPLSSSQGGQIPGAGGSLIPRETPADAAAYPSLAPSGFRRPDAIEDLLAWRRYCGDEVKKLGPDRWQVNGAAAIDTAELVRRTNNLRRGGGGRPFEIAGAGVASAPAAMGGGSQ